MTELRFCQFMVTLSACLLVFNLVSGCARIYQEAWIGAALHALGGLLMVAALDQALKSKRKVKQAMEPE